MESCYPSGNDSLHKLGGRAKGGRNLARVEHTQSTATARAYVKKSPAISQGLRYHFDRLGQAVDPSLQCFLHKYLFLDEEFGQVTRAKFFQIPGSRIHLFG